MVTQMKLLEKCCAVWFNFEKEKSEVRRVIAVICAQIDFLKIQEQKLKFRKTLEVRVQKI